MNTHKLLCKLAKKYPKRIAVKNHDYVGLKCGKLKIDTKRIVLCLDFDDFIYEEAKAFKPDLIITHHPFIFGKPSFVLTHDLVKANLYNKLLKDNIPVYSYHTNFDEGDDGMNDAIAKQLELNNVHKIDGLSMARGGFLPKEMTIDELCVFLMKKLDVNYSIPLNFGPKMIKKIAFIGGGGWSSWKAAFEKGYDCYISGDIPHHARRDIMNYGANYIDLPHEIENIFMEQMEKVLLSIDPNLQILKIKHEKSPKVITL